jgi:hypothetical protein
MNEMFNFCASRNKISLIALAPWMGLVHGGDGLEIKNQGRFGFSFVFSQETGARFQHAPRIGVHRPKRGCLSAGGTLNSDPFPQFFSAGKYV